MVDVAGPSPPSPSSPPGAPPWPAHWEADVVTADGGTVHVRPITPDDEARLLAFHARQSPESIYFRFFSARPRLSAGEVRRFTHVDLDDRVAFVALLGDDLVGVGRYDRYKASDEAEVAFFIDDAHHGRGLATILLEYLASAARDRGIRAFVATVLPTNRGMLTVFTQAGFETATRFADGVIEVRFEISPTPASMAAMDGRAARADARTVARLLEPRSVAVIGAGRRRGSIGHEILRQLLEHEFAGPVYPVNREVAHVASVPAWPSILDVPTQVDLAVIAVPAPEVLDAVEECARARVGALIVVSTGFAEAGPEGLERARALVAAAHRHGIRVLGPGSFGAINTDPGVRLHASFAPVRPLVGRVAMSLQSGTLAAGLLRQATAVGLGFSSVVAVGDKVDVSGNDLLAWWEEDERTDVIVLSLESYGNPRRFRRLAPRVSRRKPIVAQVQALSGRADTLLAQTGVVGVDTYDALLDATRVLAWQPVPAGDLVAVVADSAGAAGYAARSLTAAGLRVGTRSVPGPDAPPEAYEGAVSAAVRSGADALLVVYSAALAPEPEAVGRVVAEAVAAAPDPAVAVVAAFPGHDLGGRLPGGGPRAIPDLGFPDAAARALAAAVRYGQWRRRVEGEAPVLVGYDGPAVGSLLAAARRPGTLAVPDAAALLRAAGCTVADTAVVTTRAEAVAAAERTAGPVALKALDRSPSAKVEAAGVALDLPDSVAVGASWDRMEESLGGLPSGAVVQPMVPPGVDLRITVEPAPIVGEVLGLGLGGALASLEAAAARAVLPLTDVGAADLLERSGLAPLLHDHDDRAAVLDLLLRVGELVEERRELARVDLNPVIVATGVAVVVDTTIELAGDDVVAGDDVRRIGA